MISTISSILVKFRDAGCVRLNNVTIGELPECRKCDIYDDGKCTAFIQIQATQAPSATEVVFSNSVKDEAQRLNISIKEVRRRRNKFS